MMRAGRQVEALADDAREMRLSGSLPVPKVSTMIETGSATPMA